MKGTPETPQCGYSRASIQILGVQGVDPAKIHLFRSFDPDSPDGAEVADPYYGTPEDFARVAEEISAALPGLVKEYGSDH